MKRVVPDDESVEFKQTFTEHHYTIYAEPEQILALAEVVEAAIPNALEHETMSSSFLLFDLQSGNVMAEFARESDAFDAFREAATEDGLEAFEHLSLLFMQNGHPTPIVMEEELVRRVTTDAHLSVQGSHAPDTATSNDLPSGRDPKSRSGKFRSMAS